jgi:hypothetical protein
MKKIIVGQTYHYSTEGDFRIREWSRLDPVTVVSVDGFGDVATIKAAFSEPVFLGKSFRRRERRVVVRREDGTLWITNPRFLKLTALEFGFAKERAQSEANEWRRRSASEDEKMDGLLQALDARGIKAYRMGDSFGLFPEAITALLAQLPVPAGEEN